MKKQRSSFWSNVVENVVRVISPRTAFKRMQFKTAIGLMDKAQRAYDAAGSGRRTSNWKAQGTSATTEVDSALSKLRNRSRELCRNNPYATKAIAELANNITGIGIMPNPIDISKNQAKKLKKAWNLWANSTDCDYDGHLNYYGIAWLAARSMFESGECLIRKYIVDPSKYTLPLQLQVIEADHIDTTKWQGKDSKGNCIKYGIEFNSENKVVAYWVFENHPGDSMQFGMQSNRIPAEDIIHLFLKERPGQFRGVPFGHASMLRLKDFDEYEDAQLIRQKIAACFTIFVTETNVNPIAGLQGSDNEDRLEKVEPGIIDRLKPGQQVTAASPPDAGASYDAYTKGTLRGIAAGYGMDYVTLTGDLTGVNFSSGRMGWLQFHRNIGSLQWLFFIPTFSDKSWKWFMVMAVIAGHSKTKDVSVRWTPPRREMIDPSKEVEAQLASIEGGLTSWSETARENGYNPEELLEEIKADKQAITAAGLDFSKKGNKPQQQQSPPDNN